MVATQVKKPSRWRKNPESSLSSFECVSTDGSWRRSVNAYVGQCTQCPLFTQQPNNELK
jgi:hypothetical protein